MQMFAVQCCYQWYCRDDVDMDFALLRCAAAAVTTITEAMAVWLCHQ